MKKNVFKVALTSALILVAGYGMYISNQEVEMSDLEMANVEALAQKEYSKNYGPGKEVKCASDLHKKICMCEPNYPECTESDCY